MNQLSKHKHKKNRHKRVRAKIKGTAKRPRVSVYKSNQHLFVQFINDEEGKTLISSSDALVGAPTGTSGQNRRDKTKIKGSKTEKAGVIGEMLAKKAEEAGIKEIVFDRGGFKYHGRIKALAEGLRKGGIKF